MQLCSTKYSLKMKKKKMRVSTEVATERCCRVEKSNKIGKRSKCDYQLLHSPPMSS